MKKKDEHNNPMRVFKEQDNLVVPGKKMPERADKITSIERSEITSLAPDDINENNIFLGKKHNLHSIKPEGDSRRKKRA